MPRGPTAMAVRGRAAVLVQGVGRKSGVGSNPSVMYVQTAYPAGTTILHPQQVRTTIFLKAAKYVNKTSRLPSSAGLADTCTIAFA